MNPEAVIITVFSVRFIIFLDEYIRISMIRIFVGINLQYAKK